MGLNLKSFILSLHALKTTLNTKSVLAVLTLFAAILAMGPASVAYAHDWNDYGDDNNSIEQEIEQENNNEQDSQVVSGGDTVNSGNNDNDQDNVNEGDQVAEISDDDEGDE